MEHALESLHLCKDLGEFKKKAMIYGHILDKLSKNLKEEEIHSSSEDLDKFSSDPEEILNQ